jgi:hypothetical protein
MSTKKVATKPAAKTTKSTTTKQERLYTASEVLGIQLLTASYATHAPAVVKRVRQLDKLLTTYAQMPECREAILRRAMETMNNVPVVGDEDVLFNPIRQLSAVLDIIDELRKLASDVLCMKTDTPSQPTRKKKA